MSWAAFWKVAGVEGFLENRDELKEESADDLGPIRAFVRLWFKAFGCKRVPVTVQGGGQSHPSDDPQSLLELYMKNSYDIDLGFNALRPDVWSSQLGATINKSKNRVFNIQADDGSVFQVKLRADRTSGGAMKWLERVEK